MSSSSPTGQLRRLRLCDLSASKRQREVSSTWLSAAVPTPTDLGVTWGVTGVGVLVEEQELRITEDEPPSERAVTLGLLR